MLSQRLYGTIVVALLTISRALAQDCSSTQPDCTGIYDCYCPVCEDSLQCTVCGVQGNQPIGCTAFNATFDTYKPHDTVDDYDRGTWTGFTVAQRGAANPIIPASKKNFLRSLTGAGVFNISWQPVEYNPETTNLGALVSFDFACADPCTKTSSDRAVACELTVVAGCDEQPSYTGPFVFYYNETYSYVPNGKRYAAMESAVWTAEPTYSTDYATYNTHFCWNYTFEAVQANGKPAFLYLDNVVYNTWTEP